MLNHAMPASTPGQESTQQSSDSLPRQHPAAAEVRRSGGIISRQVQRLVFEILNDPDTEEQVGLGLLRHIAAHPGDPPGAMLAHLCDMADGGATPAYGDGATGAP